MIARPSFRAGGLGAWFPIVALLVGVAIGILAALDPVLALTATVAIVAVPAAVLKPKLILYLVVITVFTEFLTVGGITVGRLVAPLALVAVIAELAQSPKQVRHGGMVLTFVFAYALIAGASLLWTKNASGTLEQLGSLAIALVYAASFAVLVRSVRDLRIILWIVTACSVILGLFWIGSYLAGVARQATEAGDPNFFAADQVVALPLIMVLAAWSRSRVARVILGLAIAIVAASVVASLSRGGVLTLLVAGVLIILLPGRSLFRSRAAKLGFMVALAIGLAIILPVAGPSLNRRFQQGVNAQELGGRRADLWLAAESAYTEYPALGIGYGAFKPTLARWVFSATNGVDPTAFPASTLRTGQPVHNAFLESLTELGPLGLVLFLGLIWSTGASFVRTGRLARWVGDRFIRAVCLALLVGLIAFAVASVFLPTETSRTLWMFVGLGLAVPGLVSVSDGTRGLEAVAPQRYEAAAAEA